MKCNFHAENEAVAICAGCGNFICAECKTLAGEKTYCKACIPKARKVMKANNIPIHRNPIIAALLSFFLPGAGQVYNGQAAKGVIIFLTSLFLIPWLYGIIDAPITARKINAGKIVSRPPMGCLTVFLLMAALGVIALVVISMPKLLRLIATTNDINARQTLKSISKAIEDYAAEHNGRYPANESALVSSRPPYLARAYNNRTINGYNYYLELSSQGYEIIAFPVSCGITGEINFKVKKAGNISEERCR